MSKRQFGGLILMIMGIVLIVSGVVSVLSGALTKSATPISPAGVVSPSPMPLDLIVNLPAPQAMVSSPLLVRGQVYSQHEKVGLKLLSQQGEILVDTLAFVQPAGDDPDIGLFQVSLVFQVALPQSGSLRVQLLGESDRIVTSQQIPLQLRP